MEKPTLYFDLDGVLVDFVKGFKELTGLQAEDVTMETVTELLRGNTEFWENLEWMPEGEKLWNYIKYFNPIILSTATEDRSSYSGKLNWCKRFLGEDVPVILTDNKSKYARPDAVLVDDYIKNIDKWIDNKGIALHYNESRMFGIISRLYGMYEDFIIEV